MGIYLNPGSEKYEMTVRSKIFVDKTQMINYLNTLIDTDQRFVAVSRPRRFGKTIAANMICAYYDSSIDSRALFEKRTINPANRPEWMDDKSYDEPAWDKYLNKFNVIHLNIIDFASETSTMEEMIEYLEEEVTDEIMETWPDVRYGKKQTLRSVMAKAYHALETKFVVVIDEWDCIFRRNKDDTKAQKKYLDFLRNLLKDKDYIALAYMTGILPIKKYGEHSALNMFDEYSMVEPAQLAEYVGFTDKEVELQCNKYGRSYEDEKVWYDGYLLTGIIPPHESVALKYHIYSPLSVVKSVRTGTIGNYWNETETGKALKEYIRRNYDGLKEDVAVLMQEKRLPVDVSTYQNDMTTFHSKDDIFTLLIHLGYLGYDSETKEVFIPNKEVAEVFRETTQDEDWSYLFQTIHNSGKLLEATWNGDEKTVAKMIKDAHMRAGNLTYNSEAALSYAVRLAYYAADQYYTLIREMQAGKGYADLVYIPAPRYSDKPVLLVELKWNKDEETAIGQIKDRRYPDSLEKYKGNIILVGISYDKDVRNDSPEFKHHSCKIDRA